MAQEGFLEAIGERVILCDGAMGTRLYTKGVFLNRCFDEVNLSDPGLVERIHLEYLEAGAEVVETNTYGANSFKLVKHHLDERSLEINHEGARIARAAVRKHREKTGREAWVAGSIGPLGVRLEPWGRLAFDTARTAFRAQAEALDKGGVDLYLLETFSDISEMREAIRAVREVSQLPVVAQMTIGDDGNSLYGTEPEIFTQRLTEWGADVIGINCSVGPNTMLETIEKMAEFTKCPLAVQPNAGQARSVEGRVFFLSSPDYFAKYAHRFIRSGVRLLGGCCGTTPEHIRAMAAVVRMKQHFRKETSSTTVASGERPAVSAVPMECKSELGRKLAAGEPVFSLELTPPRGWEMNKMIEKATLAREAGFDTVNIPDGPRASARVGVLAATLKILQEAGIEPIVHYVCRDRNLLGMQSDLVGAYALGLVNFLLLTGDPPVMGDYPRSTPVFDVDSIGLTNLASALNRGVDLGQRTIGKPTGFLIGVGVNPTAVNLDLEIERYYWKVEAGTEFAISQPVFDPDALLAFMERANAFLESKGLSPVPLLAGIWPLQSLKNAEFLQNEVPGVSIPESVMTRLHRAAGSPADEKAVGLEVAREQIAAILPSVEGLQISSPFGRVQPAVKLLRYARGLV